MIRTLPDGTIDTRPTVASIPRSDELSLATMLRTVASRVAAMQPLRAGVCLFCERQGAHLHKDRCVWSLARRAAVGVARHDAAALLASVGLTEASAPKPLPECSWCGKPATAVDEAGDPACAACAAPREAEAAE